LRLIVLFACCVAVSGATVVSADEDAARQTLRSYGLEPFQQAWVCPSEIELLHQLDLLRQRESAYRKAKVKADSMVATYDRYRRQLLQLQEFVDANLALIEEGGLAPLEQQRVQKDIKRAKDQLLDIEREVNKRLNALDEASPFSLAMVDLVGARSNLTANLLAIRRHKSALGRRYKQLRDNPNISDALRTLGDELGPADRYAAKLKGRLDRLSEELLNGSVPVYRRSGKFRVGIILGEDTPATVTYQPTEGPTLIPESLLSAAGLEIPGDSKTRTIREAKRKIEVRQAVVPSIRVGGHLIEDATVLVLPPEAEDLGARLTDQTFGNRRVQLDERRLSLRIAAP